MIWFVELCQVQPLSKAKTHLHQHFITLLASTQQVEVCLHRENKALLPFNKSGEGKKIQVKVSYVTWLILILPPKYHALSSKPLCGVRCSCAMLTWICLCMYNGLYGIVPPPYTKVKTELISSVIIRGGAIKNKFRLWCCYSIISHLY